MGQTGRFAAEEYFGKPHQSHNRVLHETWILGTILAMDTASTAVLIAMNRAREANPIMQFYVAKGLLWFVLVKVGMFAIVPLVVLELLRRMGRERFVRRSLRLGIAAYLLIYVGGSSAQWIWHAGMPLTAR